MSASLKIQRNHGKVKGTEEAYLGGQAADVRPCWVISQTLLGDGPHLYCYPDKFLPGHLSLPGKMSPGHLAYPDKYLPDQTETGQMSTQTFGPRLMSEHLA